MKRLEVVRFRELGDSGSCVIPEAVRSQRMFWFHFLISGREKISGAARFQ
jgi:hypothetical protein